MTTEPVFSTPCFSYRHADDAELGKRSAVLFRLDSPELDDALEGRSEADELTSRLTRAVSEDRAQLEELAALVRGEGDHYPGVDDRAYGHPGTGHPAGDRASPGVPQ